MSMEDFIITVYCLVDELIKKLENGQKLRKRGFNPALSDSEMITMEVVSEFLSIDTDKGAWEYFVPIGVLCFRLLGHDPILPNMLPTCGQ